MKLLHVTKLYHPWIGGVERIARQLAEGLGGEALVCQPSGRRLVDAVSGVKVYRAASWGIYWGMPISLDFFRLFRERVKSADTILLHHPFPLAVVAYLLFARRKPLVIWYHSDIVRQRHIALLFNPFLQLAIRRARIIFIASERLKRNSAHLSSVQEKTIVVPFGIDREYFSLSPEIESTARKIAKKYGKPLVLSVGRLTYYKGYEYLIEAMRTTPDAQLLIVGGGKEEVRLNALIAQWGLKGRVHIVPHVDDVRPYYAAADVFVLPSSEPSEAFGIVQAEAMAFGVPVVNTDLPTGVPEVSIPEVTGITVPPKDVDSLSKALRTLLTDPHLRHRYGTAARERVATTLNEDTFIRAVQNALEALQLSP